MVDRRRRPIIPLEYELYMDPSLGSWGITYSDRNKVLTQTGLGPQSVALSSVHPKLKAHFEYDVMALTAETRAGYVGMCTNAFKDGAGYPSDSRSIAIDLNGSTVILVANDVTIGTLKASAPAVGDVVVCEYDGPNGLFYAKVNDGLWNGSASVDALKGGGYALSGIGAGPYFPMIVFYFADSTGAILRLNVGQYGFKRRPSQGFSGPNEVKLGGIT